MLLDEILSQAGPVSALRRALSQGRLAPAYLFEGPGGVGKLKTALALAATAICRRETPGCGTCETCTRVLAMNHADVRVFVPRAEGARNLPVDFIRDEIIPFSKFAPFEARAAFLIFSQADVCFPAYYPEGANALLKTLEEPRANLCFVLLAERPDRLLPTVRSRCQRIRFNRLPSAVLDEILGRNGVPDPLRTGAAALADGRADLAMELARGQKVGPLLDLVLEVDATIAEGKLGPLLDLAERLAEQEDLPLIMETLARLYRDMAGAALGSPAEELLFNRHIPAIGKRASRNGARRAADRVQLIFRTAESLERNANAEIALDALLFALGSV
jgi:DNA polymerase-3 subunit delta'